MQYASVFIGMASMHHASCVRFEEDRAHTSVRPPPAPRDSNSSTATKAFAPHTAWRGLACSCYTMLIQGPKDIAARAAAACGGDLGEVVAVRDVRTVNVRHQPLAESGTGNTSTSTTLMELGPAELPRSSEWPDAGKPCMHCSGAPPADAPGSFLLPATGAEESSCGTLTGSSYALSSTVSSTTTMCHFAASVVTEPSARPLFELLDCSPRR